MATRKVWAAREEVRRHHAELWAAGAWCAEWGRPTYLVARARSLRSLAEQGYGMEEVAVMFGISRERLRQWAVEDGVSDLFSHLGKGTKPRLWDPQRACFRAMTPDEYKRATAAQRSQHRAHSARTRGRRMRWLMVAWLRKVGASLGRNPTLPEAAAAVGMPLPSALLRWRGRRFPGAKHPIPYASLARRWFRLAGLQVRSVGQQGHRGRETAHPAGRQ